jgi:DNA-binding NarL/FixJ family response regulator
VPSIRAVIVDRQPVFREGLKSVLAPAADIAVVGESGGGQNALAVVDEQRPDLVILDPAPSGVDGCSVAREIARRLPAARLMALTARQSAPDVLAALDAGFVGYALKCQPPDQILEALRQIARGERYLEPRLAYLGKRAGTTHTVEGLLSPREREVFHLLARGCSNATAARTLSISPKTLETHRFRLCRKLAVRNIAELIRLAADLGVTSTDGARSELDADDGADQEPAVEIAPCAGA